MPQYSVPFADGDVSDWTCSTGTNRSALIDEGGSPNDSDYIWRSSGGLPINTNDFQLTEITPLVSTGWVLYIRAKIEGAGSVPLNVSILCDGTPVAAQSYSVTSTSFVDITYNMTPSECAAISDWTLTYMIIDSHGGGGVNIRVSNAGIMIPDPSSTTHNRTRMGVGK